MVGWDLFWEGQESPGRVCSGRGGEGGGREEEERGGRRGVKPEVEKERTLEGVKMEHELIVEERVSDTRKTSLLIKQKNFQGRLTCVVERGLSVSQLLMIFIDKYPII